MAITNFIPELWSAAVQMPFEANLVYGQPLCVNRDYEGEIKQQGDTVHVTSIARPTIRPYDKSTDLTTEDVADSGDSLVIDQGDYFSFRVNDVDKVQAAGNFQGPATQEAGQGMAEEVDTFLSGRMAAGATNRLGVQTIASATPASAYNTLIKLRTKLTNAKVPNVGRWVAVNPEFYGVLLRDDRFVRVDASGTDEGLRNGLVGRAAGFDILESNTTPSAVRTVADAVTTSTSPILTSATANFTQADVGALLNDGDVKVTAGTTIASVQSATSVTMSANSKAAGTGISLTIGTPESKLLIAGVATATSLAMQITETEALRSEVRFADVIRGLQVYGGKVFRPTGLAVAPVVVTES